MIEDYKGNACEARYHPDAYCRIRLPSAAAKITVQGARYPEKAGANDRPLSPADEVVAVFVTSTESNKQALAAASASTIAFSTLTYRRSILGDMKALLCFLCGAAGTGGPYRPVFHGPGQLSVLN